MRHRIRSVYGCVLHRGGFVDPAWITECGSVESFGKPWRTFVVLCRCVMGRASLLRKLLIDKMERAKGFEPSTFTLAR